MKTENRNEAPYGNAPLAPDPSEAWEDPLWLLETDCDRGLQVVDALLNAPSRIAFWTAYIEALRALGPDADDESVFEVVPQDAFAAIVRNGAAAAVADGSISVPLVESILRNPRELRRLHRAVVSERHAFRNAAAASNGAVVGRTRGDALIATARVSGADVDPEVFKLHAELYQALANAKRLEIIHHLLDGPKSAGELRTLLRMSKSSLSQHTSLLADRGLIRSAPRGKMVVYEIAGEYVADLYHVTLKINRTIFERKALLRAPASAGSTTI